jgi:4-amino-4-deoxy-L-arabinose transferase-like glycosyltransferase
MKDWKILVLIAAATLLLFSHGMGERPLWEFDEAKHAQVAKEMIVKGDWITPTFNGIPFYNKPILHFWMVMVSFFLFGINEFAARFPSVILGVCGVIVVYLWARRIYDSRMAGILSSVILATSVEYIILSQNVIHDMSLAFFINLCLFLFHTAYKEQRLTTLSLLLFFASLGCAVLAKGPLGAFLILCIIGAFLLVDRRGGFIKSGRLVGGVLISLVVALPWYVSMIQRNPDYFRTFLVEGQLNRFFSSVVVHQEPFYYYLPVLIIGFFPWIAFIPAALVHHARRFLNDQSGDSLFLLIAVLAPLFFFSISHSKLPTYILPVFPALAILTGSFWSHCINGRHRQKGEKHCIYSCVSLSSALFAGLVAGFIIISKRYPVYVTSGLPLIIILMASAILIALAAWKKKLLFAHTVISAMMLISIVYSIQLVLPKITPFKSPKNLSLRLKALTPPDNPVIFYPRLREPVVFYSDRHATVIRTMDGMEQYLSSAERVFCVMSIKDYEELKQRLTLEAYVIDQEGYMVVISNQRSTVSS